MSAYKWCFVPECKNTSSRNPSKVFFAVPKEEKRRKKWFRAARRDFNVSLKSTLYCCDDHFKMEEDMENFMRYKMVGGHKLLKKDAFPHVFGCQEDRQRALAATTRKFPMKRTQQRLIEDALSVDKHIPPHITSHDLDEESVDIGLEQQADCSEAHEGGNATSNYEPLTPTKTFSDASVQTYVSHRSKGINCNMPKKEVLNIATSPIKLQRDVSTSPLKRIGGAADEEELESVTTDSEDMTEGVENVSGSEYEPCSSESDESAHEFRDPNAIFSCVSRKSKMYIGVPDEWFPHAISLLMKYTKLGQRDIILTLMKIKVNDSFERLADQFCISCGHACKIFNRTVPILAHTLKELIYWPDRVTIKRQLPIPFRFNFYDVQSIIDCLEIEIEKPSDPVNQALTWSQYKGCNTLKYLISSTPDGFINFVSEGYGGRISDSLLVEECGFLERLPKGAVVMADRGFKGISQLLQARSCQLVKPPSVAAGQISTKEDVLATKRIASLRIHIERVIRRLREFEFLKPHSIIPSQLIASTNDVIVMACGLVNTQSPIIKV